MNTFTEMAVTLAFLTITALPAFAKDHTPRESTAARAGRITPCLTHGAENPAAQMPSSGNGSSRAKKEDAPLRDSASDRQRL